MNKISKKIVIFKFIFKMSISKISIIFSIVSIFSIIVKFLSNENFDDEQFDESEFSFKNNAINSNTIIVKKIDQFDDKKKLKK